MVHDFARKWVNLLGAFECSLTKLNGGINSSVYSCRSDNTTWIIKGYSSFQSGEFDRMRAEINFLKYASQVAPHYIPQLIDFDLTSRCIILENIDGIPFSAQYPPTRTDISHAVSFFSALNENIDLASNYIDHNAADGYLSISQHISSIRDRISYLSIESLPSSYKDKVNALIKRSESLVITLSSLADLYFKNCIVLDTLLPDHRCISPSDFGFHNAIKTLDGVKFIDFEFAGWDDPCKALIDFMLQPKVPITANISPLASFLSPQKLKMFAHRYRLLYPVFTLKWACIFLNIFDSRRNHFLNQYLKDSDYTIIESRLQLAERYLDDALMLSLIVEGGL